MRQTKTLTAAMLAIACVAGGLASTVVLAPTAAYAQKAQKVGAKVGKPLKEAQDAAAKGDFKTAMAKVREADAVSGKSAYEQHTVNEFLAYVAINQKDYGTAAKAYEATLNSGQLPAAQVPQRMKAVLQLYYQTKNYDKANQFASRYLSEVGQDTEVQLMQSQIAYIKQDYATSGKIIRQVIKSAEAGGRPVKKEWLELDMSCAYKQGDMNGVGAALKQLVSRYPTKEYWEQLLDVSMRKSGLSDKDNLDFYRLKRANGLIKDSGELVEMAQLAIQAGLPGEAKTILEKGVADGMIGNGANKERENRLLNMARNLAATDLKSLAADEASATKAATGEPSVKIGEAYASYGQNDKAISLITAGIAKGGLKNADDAKLRLGLAQLAAGKNAEAAKSFRDVKATGNTGTIADLWRIYVSNKS